MNMTDASSTTADVESDIKHVIAVLSGKGGGRKIVGDVAPCSRSEQIGKTRRRPGCRYHRSEYPQDVRAEGSTHHGRVRDNPR